MPRQGCTSVPHIFLTRSFSFGVGGLIQAKYGLKPTCMDNTTDCWRFKGALSCSRLFTEHQTVLSSPLVLLFCSPSPYSSSSLSSSSSSSAFVGVCKDTAGCPTGPLGYWPNVTARAILAQSSGQFANHFSLDLVLSSANLFVYTCSLPTSQIVSFPATPATSFS